MWHKEEMTTIRFPGYGELFALAINIRAIENQVKNSSEHWHETSDRLEEKQIIGLVHKGSGKDFESYQEWKERVEPHQLQ